MPRYDISIRVAATRYTVTDAKPKLEPKALFLRICGLFCEHLWNDLTCNGAFFNLFIRFWCVLITTSIVYTHRINVLFLVICVCTLGIKYCHHYILFLSLCRHVFDAFSCNIHHEERYLKFADISFENIDTAKKYRDNIDTFLRRYPSPNKKFTFVLRSLIIYISFSAIMK